MFPAREISVLIADFSEQAMAGIEVLEENIAQCVPFLEEAPNLIPLATALVAFAASWTAGVEGDRGAYFTAEEHGPPGPPLGHRHKAPPQTKRRPTVAQLAAQQGEIVQALANPGQGKPCCGPSSKHCTPESATSCISRPSVIGDSSLTGRGTLRTCWEPLLGPAFASKSLSSWTSMGPRWPFLEKES